MAIVAVIEVSARIGAMIVHAAAARGVAPSTLKNATGFDAAIAADPDARIAISLEESLWTEAARQTGDDAFGLHAAELLRPGMFDVLDYVIRTAPTVRAAFERLSRYNRLEHDVAVFTLLERPGRTTRVEHAFRMGGLAPCRHAAEFTLASQVIVGSQITTKSLKPLGVEFGHAGPSSVTEHARIFGVTPRFGAACNALEWDDASLDLPVPGADPVLSRVVERHAEALLAARPAATGTHADRVRQLLATSLADGDASLKKMAEKLKMSERSLQRRLTNEGITFEALLDELRRDLSLRYLADSAIAVSEVAYLLGYSEPSPFHRAFRRWTGMTPNQLRSRAA
jgi:AraC-like DNA-binding protein